MINLDDIINELDKYFRIKSFPPDSPFSFLVPEKYAEINLNPGNYFTDDFLELFHGLMIRNSNKVTYVYSIVFLNEEILDKVFKSNRTNVLLISHHPLDMETGNRGFLPLSVKYLDELKKREISVYSIHTPLDVHGKISTSRALAREVGLKTLRGNLRSEADFPGICVRFSSPVSFEDLLTRVSAITGVEELNFIKKQNFVENLGVVAGGCDMDHIIKASEIGCDSFLTGTYFNQVKNEIGKQYREAFEKVKESVDINLVECSHYASESLVMKIDILDFCTKRWGISCEFLPQDNPWH
jgi:putative NIF3 family GTP cyclohydrolase 1 type 2